MTPSAVRLAPLPLRRALLLLAPLALLASVLLGLLAQSASAHHTPVPSPGLVGPPAAGQSTTPQWTFTTPADPVAETSTTYPNGATRTVTIQHAYDTECEYGAQSVAAASFTGATCTSPYTGMTAGDGSYVLSVRTVETTTTTTTVDDGTGPSTSSAVEHDHSVVESAAYLLDTTAPVVTVTAPGTGPYTGWTVDVSDGGSGVTLTCTLSKDGGPPAPVACAEGTVKPSLMQDGSYALTATATDAAGNGPSSGGATYVFTGANPVVTITGPTGGTDVTPIFSVAVTSVSPVTVGCTVNAGTVATCSSTEVSVSLGADGSYTISVDATDGQGRTGSSTHTYLLDAYAIAVNGPITGQDRSPAWTFTGGTPGGFTCNFSGAGGAGGACSDGGFVANQLPTTTGETYTLVVTSTDGAGNSDTVTVTYLLDTDAAVALAGPTSPGSDRTPSWTFTASETFTVVSCTLSPDNATTASSCSTAGYTAGELPLTDSTTYTLTVVVRDTLGNERTLTSTYVLDTTASTLVLEPATGQGSTDNDTTPSWTFTGDTFTAPTCTLTSGGVAIDGGGCTATGFTSPTLASPTTGTTYVLTVSATDSAGNLATASTTYVLDTTAPTLSLSPADATGNDTTPTWTIGGAGYVSAQCVLTTGTTVVQTGACDTLTTHTANTLPATPGTAYVLTVTVTDAAGNTASTNASYVLDTINPSVSVTTPADAGNDTTPTWTIDGGGYVSAQCVLTTGTTVVGTGACDALTSHTSDELGLTDGTSYTLTVTVTDAAGNTASASDTYLLDTTAPTVTVAAPADATGNDRTPTWTIGGAGFVSAQCVLTTGTTIVDTGACDALTSHTSDELGLTDGTSYTLTVTVTDAAGNTASASDTYLLDTTAPTVLLSPADATGNDTTPTWTIGGAGYVSAQCVLTTGTTVVDTGACDALTSHTSAQLGLTDGTSYTLTVTVTDAAGNTASASATYLLDTTVPTVTVAAPAATGNDRTPTWTIGGGGFVSAQCVLTTGTTVVQTGVCDTLTTHTADLLTASDGTTYALTVTVTDAAGNTATATATYLLDTTAPTVTVAAPAATGNDRTPIWTIAGAGFVSAQCVLTSGKAVVQTGACDALTSHTSAQLPLTDGTSYTLTVTVTDAAGNTATSSDTYLLDTTAPTVSLSPADATGNDTTPTWTIGGAGFVSAQCVLTTGTAVVQTGVCDALTSHTSAQLPLTPGTSYTLTVTVTDAAGNTASASATYLLDTVDPTVTVRAPATSGNDTTPEWTLTGDGYVSAQCVLTTGTTVVSTGACDALTSHTSADLGLTDGTSYTLTVTVTDAAGNTATSSDTYLLDTTAPTVSLSPADATGNDTTPTWTIGGAGYVSAQCVLTTGTTVVQTGVCDALTSHTSAQLPLTPGTSYTLTVTVTDAAGNTASSTATYLLDTVDPTVTVRAPATSGNDTTPEWTLTGDGYVSAQCVLTTGTTVVGTGACDALTSHTSADLGLTDGTSYTLTVTVTDAAGNTANSTATYLLDTTAPTVTVTSPATTGNDRTPTWTVGGSGYVSAACVLTTGATVVQTGTCGALTSHTSDDLGLTDGTSYTLTVTVTDAAGNTATSSATYLLDTTVPTVSLSPADATGNDTTPTWTIGGGGFVSAQCVLTTGTTVVQTGVCDTLTTHTADLLTASDGTTYALTVTVTDAADNTATATATYLLDTTAPTVTVAAPAATGNDRTPTWTIGGSGYVSAQCVLTTGTTIVETGACDALTSHTSDELGLTDGTSYTLTVTVTDAAGNTASASDTYLLDTTAPTVSLSPADATGSDITPEWTLTGDGYVSAQCVLTSGGVVVQAGECDTLTLHTADMLTSPTSGTDYLLTVTITDAAGNVSTAPATYTLDTVADFAAVTAPTATPGTADNDRTPTWTFTSESGARSVTCVLTSVADGTFFDGPCTSAGSFTAPMLPDTSGTVWTLTVTVVDALGNISTTTLPTYLLDTVADFAAVTAPTATPGTADNDRTPTWTFTSESGARSVTCVLTSVADGTFFDGPCTSAGSFTAPMLPDTSGTVWTLTVTVVDALGNISTTTLPTYLLDTVADFAAVTAPTATPGTADNDRTPTWTFTSESGARSVTCVLTSVADGTFFDGPCTSAGSFTAPMLPDTSGTVWTLTVTVVDALGNISTTTLPTYLLDTLATLTVVDPVSPGNDTTPSWTFTTEAGATVTCVLAGPGVPTTGGTCTTAGYTAPTLPSTAGADYVLTVTVTDALGNVTVYERPAYRLDTQLPTVTITVPPSPSREVTVTWGVVVDEALADATCELRRAGVVVLSLTNCPGSTTISLPGDGRYDLVVTLVDLAGNRSITTSSVLVHDATVPPAPIVSPSSLTTNARTATWTITAEAGVVTTCRLTRGGVLIRDWTACSGTYSYPLPGDGSYLLEVVSTDSVGPGPVTSVSYLLDTVAPAAPRAAGPTGPSQSRTPSWTVGTDAGTTTECRLVRGGTVINDWMACAGGFSADLAALPDGGYVLESRATDAAGNVSAVGTSAAYVLDTTAPLAPSVTGPSGPSQSRTPSFTWTGESGARSECQLSRDGAVVGGWVACSSGYAPTLSPDGTWTLAVRLVDAAGNVGEPASSGGYVLDTTAPPPPVVTPPSTPGRDLAPSWGAVVEGGTTLECRFTGPDGVAGPWTTCALPLVTPLTGRPDGTYQLEVRATDVAGNVSGVGSGSYVLDTVAPAAAVVIAPTGPGRARTPTFTFTTEAGAATRCRLTSGSTLLSDFVTCTSPVTYDLTDRPDGTYTLTVRVTDAAGNPGPGATGTYVLDTTGPLAAVFTLTPGSPSLSRSATWAFTVEPGSSLICRLTFPTGAVREISGCSSPLTVDLTGLPDGSYTLTIRAVDGAGNVGAVATSVHVLDSTALAAPVVTPPATPDRVRTPTWTFTPTTGAAECRLVRGTTVVRDWGACTTPTSFTADLFNQPDGTYSLLVRVKNAAGAVSAATTSRYVLDTTPPAAATLVGPPTPSTNRAPTWSIASAEAGATAMCRVLVFDSVLRSWEPCAVSPAGSLHTVDLTGRGDGTYTLVVRLTDAAGNIGTTTASSAYVLDTAAPAAVGVTGPDTPGRIRNPTWLLSTSGGTQLECRLSSAAGVIADWLPCAGEFTADLTDLPDGTYTLAVRAVSAAGTSGPPTAVPYVLSTTGPSAPTAVALSGVRSPSNNRAPTWTFTLPAGTTGFCRVVQGTREVDARACSGTGFTLDLSSAGDGPYTLTVFAVDAAGNRTAALASTYVLDTEPTDRPVFTQVPGATGSTLDPQWRYTVVRGASAQCRLLYDGRPLDDWASCDPSIPYTATLTGRPDGRYTLQVRAVDSADNTSEPQSDSYLLDRAAVPLVRFTATPTTPDRVEDVSWTVTAPDGVTLECRVVAPDGTTTWGPCGTVVSGALRTTSGAALLSGTVRLDLAGRPDGEYVLEVRVVQADGRTGAVSRASYVLDTRPPTAPAITISAPVGKNPTVTWFWTAPADDLVECRLVKTGAGAVTAFAECADGLLVADLTRFGQGSYLLEMRLTDAAGNSSLTTGPAYRYDTTSPGDPAFTGRPSSPGTDRTVTWTFTVPGGTTATCTVKRDAGVIRPESACTAGQYDLNLSGLPDGGYTLTVRLTDLAGNTSGPTSSTYVLASSRSGGPVRVGLPPLPPPFDPPPGTGTTAPPPPAPGRTGTAAPAPAAPRNVPGPATISTDDDILRLSDGRFEGAPSAPDAPGRPDAAPGEPDPGPSGQGNPLLPDGFVDAPVPNVIRDVAIGTITKPTLPLALLAIVVLFLLAQNRIDRRDPKLAAAPVEAEPELDFTTVIRTTGVRRREGAQQ